MNLLRKSIMESMGSLKICHICWLRFYRLSTCPRSLGRGFESRLSFPILPMKLYNTINRKLSFNRKCISIKCNKKINNISTSSRWLISSCWLIEIISPNYCSFLSINVCLEKSFKQFLNIILAVNYSIQVQFCIQLGKSLANLQNDDVYSKKFVPNSQPQERW